MTNIFTAGTDKDQVPTLKAAFNMLLLSVGLIFFIWFSLWRIGHVLDFTFLISLRIRVWDAFWLTVGLSAASLGLSLFIGIVSATLQSGKVLILRYLFRFYVIVIRGTPLITQIYLFYYIVGTAVGITNRFFSGVLILSVFEGAYIAEIIRGSLLSMDGTQLEAAKAVGFTKRQTAAYVILPQLAARTLPALTGQAASLIKDSSLLSVISLIELTQTAREISADHYNLFESFISLGALYLVLTLPVSYISKRLERRFNYET